MSAVSDMTINAQAERRPAWPWLFLVVAIWSLLLFPGVGIYGRVFLSVYGLAAGALLFTAFRRGWIYAPSLQRRTIILGTTLPLIVLVRLLHISHTSDDFILFLHPWYCYLQAHGVSSYQKMFSDYTPFFTYMLGIPALVLPALDPLLAVKAISFIGDGLAAFFVYRIVALKYSGNSLFPLLACLLFLLLPTVIINSAYLGQCDVWYAAFELGCVYFMIREKPFCGMLSYGFAFALKLQAVFLSPFLLILILNRRLPWFYLAAVPLVYAVTCMPAWLAGRSWYDLATIYIFQFGEDDKLSHHAPTLYVFLSKRFQYTNVVKWGGILIAGLAMAVFSLRNRRVLRSNEPPLPELYVLLALVSVALTPFFLPKMHDRYFFPADVFSLVVAMLLPRKWYLPACYQVISAFSVYKVISTFDDHLGLHPYLVIIAAILNCAVSLPLYWQSIKKESSRFRLVPTTGS